MRVDKKESKSKSKSKGEGLHLRLLGNHEIQRERVAEQVSAISQGSTPSKKQTFDEALEAMLADSGLPDSWDFRTRKNVTKVTLCRLDPMRWRYDNRRDVWRYYIDGGLSIVAPNKKAPTMGVLCDCHDNVIIPILWTDNILPESITNYWNIVFKMDDMLDELEDEREDLTERILELKEKLGYSMT